ncbi:hypothetical protein D1970_14580 [Mesobacillus zeae]|uniref:Uncharacterized protein n=1 Tax=Mesobacillus zeae TaxID=1917180 RepID=A0A398B1L4_9BACI|nr:hypothetical protein D1970_14580 [Mesobacillus zeae]
MFEPVPDDNWLAPELSPADERLPESELELIRPELKSVPDELLVPKPPPPVDERLFESKPEPMRPELLFVPDLELLEPLPIEEELLPESVLLVS